jgi:hypothetical protein
MTKRGMDFDDDILFPAAWMYDLGVFCGAPAKRSCATFPVGSGSVQNTAQNGTVLRYAVNHLANQTRLTSSKAIANQE